LKRVSLMMFSLVLLLVIMLGCATVKPVGITLPPEPQREAITATATPIEIILYYEALVRQWEAWAKSVESMVN